MKIQDILWETALPFGTISESSLSRLVSMTKSKDVCIATAYRKSFTTKQNRQRNKQLFSMLQSKKMGGYMLIGHWLEAPDGVEWSDATPEQLSDGIEESVLFVRPDAMTREHFLDFCVDIAKKFNQDAVITHLQNDGVFLYYKNGNRERVGSTMTVGKVNQLYSHLRGGNQTPFVFEGALIPETNFGKFAFSINNIRYLSE